MLSIQTNVNSMNAQENLRLTNLFQGRTIARLTSGYRINESGDDAAGLAVANKFRSDVAELMQGVRNANDGLSTLQIIDGGLNNISKMLDRLKTLATQSASSTFEGDRATLDREYTDLLSEIDRQAANIGLGSAGGSATRYNKNLNVYVGGGMDYTGNSGVLINLGSSSDQVTYTSLGLSGTNVLGGSGITVGSLHAAGATTTNTTFDFAVDGDEFAVTVHAASTLDDAVKELNDQIGGKGLRATIEGTALKIYSSKAWTVDVTGGAATALLTANTTAKNDGLNQSAFAMASLDAGDADGLRITLDNGTSVSVSIPDGETLDNVVDLINAKSKEIGVTAVHNAADNGFILMSKSGFTLEQSADDDGTYAAAGTYTAATVNADDTKNAESALAAINSANERLGIVQGKVGTAQNKIAYAIQLAQSQITSFSAAESRIRDADVAQEAANLTKAQVLQQASLAALAQANSAPQSVLSLLRG